MAQDTAVIEQVEQFMQEAFRLHRSGDHAGARRIYERVISAVPRHPTALQMLASICYYNGDEVYAEAYRERALRSYRAAVRDMPDQLRLRAAFANLLLSADLVEEAQAHIDVLPLPINSSRTDPEVFRQRRAAGAQRGVPLLVMNTIPKSASETIWNHLADGHELAQCYVSIGLFPQCTVVPDRLQQVSDGGIITKEHLAPSAFNVAALRRHGIDRIAVHLRDPRQQLLSWVHFVRDQISRAPMGPLWRQTCPPAQVLAAGLPETVDWCIEHYLPLVVDFIEGWQRVGADVENGLDVLFCTFEEFRTDPSQYYARLQDFFELPRLEEIGADERQSVHLRKGTVDEWREVFSPQQRERAEAAIGRGLLDAHGWPRST